MRGLRGKGTARAAESALLMMALLAGCATIHSAHEAQLAVAAAAREDGTNAAPERVELAGFRLPDFFSFALANRPDVRTAKLAVSNAVLAIRTVQADGPFVPRVETSAGYSRRTANGRHFTLEKTDGDPTGTIGFDVLVYDFGRTRAAEAEARENLAAAEVQLMQTGFAVFDEVAAAYFSLLEADALLEAAHTNEFMFAEHLRQAEALYAAEEVRKLDVLRARVDLADARLKTVVASNDSVKAAATFLSALGVTSEEASRTDVLPPREGALWSVTKELDGMRFAGAEGLAHARRTSPELAYRRAKLRAASANVDWRVADLFPSLGVDGSLSFTDRIWNFGWAADAVQSVFLGYRKTTAVEQAVVAMKSAREELAAAEQELSGALAKIVASRDSARKSLEAAQTKVHEAKANLETAAAQYRLGDVSRVEFTDAVQLYTEAIGQRASAFYAGQRAEAELMALVGRPPAFVEEVVPGWAEPKEVGK